MSNIAQATIILYWHYDRSNLEFTCEGQFCKAFSCSLREQKPSGIATATDYLGAQVPRAFKSRPKACHLSCFFNAPCFTPHAMAHWYRLLPIFFLFPPWGQHTFALHRIIFCKH